MDMERQPAPGKEQPLLPAPASTVPARCQFCEKEITRFISLAPMYCPFCGGIVDKDAPRWKDIKESNPLTGRALWPLKWSFVGIIIGMALLLTASVLVPIVMIFAIIAQDPTLLEGGVGAIETLVYALLLNPTMTALLSLTELVLVIPPFAILRKYRKSIKERFMLLGWKPYSSIGTSPGRRTINWSRLGKNIGISLFLAIGLVGMQFIIIILNQAMWEPLIPGGSAGMEGADISLTPTNPFEFIILVASMIFIVAPTEEMLFRGLSQQGLEFHMNEKRALVISALLFTMVHVVSGFLNLASLPFLFFPYFYLSLVLCGIYWKTKDLNLMIFTHGFYNSLLVLYSYLYAETGAIADIFVYLSFAAFAVLGIYVVMRILVKRHARVLVGVAPVVKAS
jgi:membrane protease YdiL (CAAX protease family)